MAFQEKKDYVESNSLFSEFPVVKMPINCSLEEFQTKFIHDDAPYSLPAYHRHKTQDFNVQSTPWVPQKIY